MTGAGPTDPTDPSDPFGETRQQGAVPPPLPSSPEQQSPEIPSDEAPTDQTLPTQSQWSQHPPGQMPPVQNPPTRSFEPIEGQQYPYSVPIPADDYYGTQSAYGSQQQYQPPQDPAAYGYAYGGQQPPAAGGGPDEPPRHRTGRWIALGLVVVVALGVIVAAIMLATKGSDNSSSSASTGPTTATAPTSATSTTTSSAPSSTDSGEVVVTYEVTGGPLLITYFGKGGMQTVPTPASPWSVTVPLNNGFASVTAISKGSPVTCTIKRGDTVLSTQTSPVLALCNATGVS